MNNTEKIQLKRKVLELQHQFIKIGINSFPREYVAEQCPYKSPSKIAEWINSASNVWHLRNCDAEIVNHINDAYEVAKHKIKNAQVQL